MFLTVFVEVALLAIIIGGATYGYRKGFFALVVKPVKLAVRFGASLLLSIPLGNAVIISFISPMLSRKFSGDFADIVISIASIALACLIIYFFSGIALSTLTSVIDSCIKLGLIGKINGIVGFAIMLLISIMCSWIFVSLSDHIFSLDVFSDSRLVAEFEGGLLYEIIKKTSPFIT